VPCALASCCDEAQCGPYFTLVSADMPVAGAREATHAGSWYTSSGAALAAELDGWLEAVRVDAAVSTPKAIIAPHAG
jgi:hypothetical protein